MSKRGNGEGSIFQRASDGRWVGTITISAPGRPRQRRSVVRKLRGDVVIAMRELQRGGETSTIAQGGNLTVRTYLEAWLVGAESKVRSGDLRDRSLRRYEELLRQHVTPEIGSIALSKLAIADVRVMIATLSSKPGRAGKPLSPTTVGHARNALRAALADAVNDGLIARNPAAGRGVGAPKAVAHLVEALTPEQADSIVEAVRDDRYGCLYRVLLWTGLRLGEATALRWADVDHAEPDGWIRVRRSYGVVGGQGRFAEPKTKQSRRDVPIIDDVFEALREQRRRQREARLLAGPDWVDQGLVFAGPTGGPLDPRSITKRLHVLLAPIGLPGLRTHDLRHGYATLLIRQGAQIPTIAKLLGHASPVMTLNVYGHVANDSLQEAAGRLNRLRRAAS